MSSETNYEELAQRVRALEKASAEHRQTEGILENVFSSHLVMVAHLDTDFNFIRVSPSYAEAKQQSPEFFVGKNYFDICHDERDRDIFCQVLETGQTFVHYAKSFEYAEAPGQGITYWDREIRAVTDRFGNRKGLILFLMNVTDRNQAEESLWKSEVRY
jgi:PAS domain S-box-containing protein